MRRSVVAGLCTVLFAAGVTPSVRADWSILQTGPISPETPPVRLDLQSVTAASVVEITVRTRATEGSATFGFRLYSRTEEVLLESGWVSTADDWTEETFVVPAFLSEALQPAYTELESSADGRYELGIFVTDRLSHNDAGTGVETARSLDLPAMISGDLRSDEPGHFYEINIGADSSLALQGTLTGDPEEGSPFELTLLDAAQAEVARLLEGTVTGQEAKTASFANSGVPRSLVLRIGSAPDGPLPRVLGYDLMVGVADATNRDCETSIAGTVCRPAVAPCDAEEVCDGQDPSCPPDQNRATPCTECCDDGNPCTIAACQPSSPDCPSSQPVLDGMPCEGGICIAGECIPDPDPDDPEAPLGDPALEGGGICTNSVATHSIESPGVKALWLLLLFGSVRVFVRRRRRR